MATPRKTKAAATQAPTVDLSATASTISAAQYRSAAQSEAVVPDLTTDTDSAPRPRLEGKGPFVLTWHIAQWIVMGGKLVPSLSPRRLQPGTSRIAKRGNRLNISDFKVHIENRGWRMVPYSWAPDGNSYMRKTEVDPSGTGRMIRVRHHTQWETLYAGTDRVGRDEAGYVAWCESLVHSGKIPPCPIVVAHGLREKTIARIERLQQQVAKGITSNERELQRAKAELDVITAYISETEEAEIANAVPVTSSAANVAVDGM